VEVIRLHILKLWSGGERRLAVVFCLTPGERPVRQRNRDRGIEKKSGGRELNPRFIIGLSPSLHRRLRSPYMHAAFTAVLMAVALGGIRLISKEVYFGFERRKPVSA
jgi:hypothetical protein